MCPSAPKPDHFISASSYTLGERFWSWFFVFFCNLQSSPLRDGNTTTTTISSTLSGLSPLLALASGSDSLRMFYEAWKHGNFTASKGADVFSSEGIAAYFSGTAPHSFSSSMRSSLASVWIRRSSVANSPAPLWYVSWAYFQKFKVTHTQKYAETPDPSEVEGRWRRWCADCRYTTPAERQVHCTLLPCKLTSCVVVVLIFKTQTGPLFPDGERSSVVSRLRCTGVDGTTTPLAGHAVSGTGDVSATGSQFKDTPLIVPTGEHLDLVKRLMKGTPTSAEGRVR